MSDVSWNIGPNGSSFIEWTREASAAFERHLAACEPPSTRHPRTALHLLGPWAPPKFRLGTPDGRTIDMGVR